MTTEQQAPLAVPLADAARLTGLPANTIRIWARSGRIPSRKIGSRRVYLPTELETWLQEQPHGVRKTVT
jgi:excisionase family DNA binding protein